MNAKILSKSYFLSDLCTLHIASRLKGKWKHCKRVRLVFLDPFTISLTFLSFLFSKQWAGGRIRTKYFVPIFPRLNFLLSEWQQKKHRLLPWRCVTLICDVCAVTHSTMLHQTAHIVSAHYTIHCVLHIWLHWEISTLELHILLKSRCTALNCILRKSNKCWASHAQEAAAVCHTGDICTVVFQTNCMNAPFSGKAYTIYMDSYCSRSKNAKTF